MIKKILIGACGLAIFAILAGIVMAVYPHAGQTSVTTVVEIYPTPITLGMSHGPVSTPEVRVKDITEFVLSTSATLPDTPARVSLYHWTAAPPLTLDRVRTIMKQFSFSEPLYTAPYEGPPQGYVAIDGPRQLLFVGGRANYTDNQVRPHQARLSGTRLPFDQAARIATDFLKARGLLEAEYQVEPLAYADDSNLTGVQFVPVLEGRPVQVIGDLVTIRVDVAADGRVWQAAYAPLAFSTTPAGDTPIVSAQEALQKAQAGEWLNMIGDQLPNLNPQPSTTLSWEASYQPGEPADLWSMPMQVFAPLDPGGQPYVQIGSLRLQDKLDELVPQRMNPLRVWGTIGRQGDELTLDVEGWSLLPQQAEVVKSLSHFISGTLSLTDIPGHALLRSLDGRVYVLHHVPSDVPQGREINTFAIETDRTENGLTVLFWTTLQSSLPADQLPTSTALPTASPASRTATAQAPRPSPTQIASTRAATPTSSPQMPQAGDDPTLPPFSDGQRLEGVQGRLTAVIEQEMRANQTRVRAKIDEEPLDRPGWTAKLDAADLSGLAQLDGLRLRVWGRYDAPARTIRVERYERADPNERIQAWLGKLVTETVEGRTIAVFETSSGERFVPANMLRFNELPPAQILSYQIIKEGVLRAETFGAYPIVETLSEHYYVPPTAPDFESYPLTVRPRVEQVYTQGKGLIERVELAYLVQQRGTAPGSATPVASPSLTRPIWRFTGHTEGGSAFEIWVDALTSESIRQWGFPTPVPLPPRLVQQ